MFTSHHFQRHYQNCESESTPQSGTSHKTCLEGFGGNGSIAWTSAVSHVGRTSNAFKVTMELQIFLFLMVVTSCLSVQYLWKYDFAKSSGNLYAPCIICSCHLPPLHLMSSCFQVQRIPCNHVITQIPFAGVGEVLIFTEVTLPKKSGVPFLGYLIHCSIEW